MNFEFRRRDMTAVEIYREAFAALRRGDFGAAWRATDQVPDCPQCRGTGEPLDGFNEIVYWRGQQYVVCATCKGTGKV